MKMPPTTGENVVNNGDTEKGEAASEAIDVLCRLASSFLSSLNKRPEAASTTQAKIMAYIKACQKEIQSREAASRFPASILATMAEFAPDRKTYELISNCGRRDVKEICQLQPILQWPDTIQSDPEYMKEIDCYDVHLSADLQWLLCFRKRIITLVHVETDGTLTPGVRDNLIHLDEWNVRDGDDVRSIYRLDRYTGLVFSDECKQLACWKHDTNVVGSPENSFMWSIYLYDLNRHANNRSIHVIKTAILSHQFRWARIQDAKFLSDNLLFVWHYLSYGNNGGAGFALWDLEKKVISASLETAVKVPSYFFQKLLLATSQYILWESLDHKLMIWDHAAEQNNGSASSNNRITDLRISTTTAVPRADERLRIDKLSENPCNPHLVAVLATVETTIQDALISAEIAVGVVSLSRSHGDRGPIDRGQLELTFQDNLLFTDVYEDVELTRLDPDLDIRRWIFQWFPCGEYAFYGDPGVFEGVLIVRLAEDETASGSKKYYFKPVNRDYMTCYQERFRDKVADEYALERNSNGRISRIKLSSDGKTFVVTSTTGRVKVVHV